jgi:hypothetical protein
MAAGAAINEDMAVFFFAIGWIVSGIVCFVLGRRWNRFADVHRFCMLRLQTWGLIYAGFGIFLLPSAWLGLSLIHHHR